MSLSEATPAVWTSQWNPVWLDRTWARREILGKGSTVNTLRLDFHPPKVRKQTFVVSDITIHTVLLLQPKLNNKPKQPLPAEGRSGSSQELAGILFCYNLSVSTLSATCYWKNGLLSFCPISDCASHSMRKELGATCQGAPAHLFLLNFSCKVLTRREVGFPGAQYFKRLTVFETKGIVCALV